MSYQDRPCGRFVNRSNPSRKDPDFTFEVGCPYLQTGECGDAINMSQISGKRTLPNNVPGNDIANQAEAALSLQYCPGRRPSTQIP